MSNIYLSEPPTAGKVLLHTSFGDIDIELWSREAPIACRNFIQLALEGYYDNTFVHRVVKDFMVQLGDPTGSGTGGESIFGRAFKDEFHGRIKFNHRGQVAMANENKPNSNHSQFMITLEPCDWLHRKHTIFGKVTGDTIFNVLRMGQVEVNESDHRPLDEIRLISVEVLWNPFDDIVPRAVVIKKVEKDELNVNLKQKRKGVKNKKLLSFEDEDTGEDGPIVIPKKLCLPESIRVTEEINGAKSAVFVEATTEARGSGLEERIRERLETKHRTSRDRSGLKSRVGDTEIDLSANNDAGGQRENDSEEDDEVDEISKARRQRQSERDRLTEGIIKSRRAVKVLLGETANKVEEDTAFHNLSSTVEAMRQKFKKKKTQYGDRQAETLERLNSFKKSLIHNRNALAPKNSGLKDLAEVPVYHGQILEEDSDGSLEGDDWYQGKLKFKKHIDDAYRIGGDGRKVDDIVVIDPRKDRK